MNAIRSSLLADLSSLVACDTRNPPRAIDQHGIFSCLQERLPGFGFEFADSGDGCISLLATRGKTDTLFNVHVDTVPVAPGWTQDPFTLATSDERAIGLGACDIKGAAACLLSAARHTDGAMAILFSSDEEAGDSRCIRDFTQHDRGYRQAIVAEPTSNHAVLAHRGYVAAVAEFKGVPGHASEMRAREDNALHHASRFATGLLELSVKHDGDEFADMRGLRLNIGRITGGIKANMIAGDAEVCFGFRPLPSHNVESLLQTMHNSIDAERLAHWNTTFVGPSLPARDAGRALSRARDLATSLNLPVRENVSFWSEAALFSAAGLTSFVLGPGDIAQAHSADEWVPIDDLLTTTEHYIRIIANES